MMEYSNSGSYSRSEFRQSLRRIIYALGLLLFTSIAGVIGFIAIEDYTPLDAIYMTVITMSTVGFGLINELSNEGKIFTVLLMIGSAGTFVYAITTITTFVIEGEIKHVYSKYRILRKVKKLTEHTIICGLGRNGQEAAMELLWQEQPFVAIERDQQIIDDFLEHHNALVINGDATHEDILEKANIQEAKGLISALSSDADNVFITLTARELNPKLKIVARASHEPSISKLKRAGANQVILPHIIGGRKMANLITRPALVDFIDTITGQGNPDLHLEELTCKDYPKLIGKTLGELRIRSKTGVVVIGRKKGNNHIELNLHADTRIDSDNHLYLLGSSAQLQEFKDTYRK